MTPFAPLSKFPLTESTSDNLGKNTGDKGTIAEVKKAIQYVENEWKDGDETSRWGKESDKAKE